MENRGGRQFSIGLHQASPGFRRTAQKGDFICRRSHRLFAIDRTFCLSKCISLMYLCCEQQSQCDGQRQPFQTLRMLSVILDLFESATHLLNKGIRLKSIVSTYHTNVLHRKKVETFFVPWRARSRKWKLKLRLRLICFRESRPLNPLLFFVSCYCHRVNSV